MNKTANTIIAVLFAIAFAGYSFCSFVIEPKIKAVSSDALNVNEQKINLPVIMYHLVLDDKKSLGEYVVHKDEFENDIKYILEMGYTPVLFSEVAEYIKGNGVLPLKPIMITFDDGYYNNYLYAYPIAKKYNVKINIALIGNYTHNYSLTKEKNPYYTHLCYDEIKEMADSNLVEFGNHTYNLHTITSTRKGALKSVLETPEDYVTIIKDDLYKAHIDIKDNAGYEMKYLAYPYGFYSSEIDNVLKDMGYYGTLSCEKGINEVTKNPACLYRLKRYNRPSGKSSGEFFKDILK